MLVIHGTFLSTLLPMRFCPIEKSLRDDVDEEVGKFDEKIALMMTFIHDYNLDYDMNFAQDDSTSAHQ